MTPRPDAATWSKLLKSFKEQHPSVVEVDERIESARRLLANFQEEILKELRGQMADLERRIRGLDQQIAELVALSPAFASNSW
jgi:uncharacterized protein involved in exopolysaccharide biosynthesis